MLNSSVLYENDFDLCLMLKDMVEKKSNKSKKCSPFKNYTKSLTARMLDSHFTNGKSEWILIQNGIDLYRHKVKCIGTNFNDFDYGEPVFLDFQPLSTRVKLMCKLIIIIQGACVERSGPPKLVQDRCIQFDASTESQIGHFQKLKANSCESILEELNLPYFEQDSLSNDSQTKFSIFSSFDSHRVSKHRKKSSSNAISDDESTSLSSYYNISSSSQKLSKLSDELQNSCDLEHYFKYRVLSKNSNKDYASVPYYQYSTIREMKFEDKGVNTIKSFLFETKPNKLNQSTSTDDLLSTYHLGYYSKYQLMSSQSLYEKKTSLKNSFTNIGKVEQENCYSTFPIVINIRRTEIPIEKNLKAALAKNESLDDEKEQICEKKSDLFKKVAFNELISANTLSSFLFSSKTNEEEDKLARLKSGPKKSSEWSMFKNNNNKKEDDAKCMQKSNTFDNGSMASSVTRITTTTTTKITEHSVKNVNKLTNIK